MAAVETTTTTTTTTTMAPAAACAACTSTGFLFVDPNDPNSVIPDSMAGPNDANGCAVLNVSYVPVTPGLGEALMSIYGPNGEDLGQAGSMGLANPATATFVCNTMGQWTFTDMGLTTAIGSVQCFG